MSVSSNVITLASAEVPTVNAREEAFKVTNLHAGESRMDLTKQWAARPHDERFLDLASLEHAKRIESEQSHARVIETRDITALAPEQIHSRDDMNKLAFDTKGSQNVASTHHAFNQLASLVKAPASYLRQLPTPIVADNLNWQLRSRDEPIQVYERHNGEHVFRAITGPEYGRIRDADVVSAVRNIAGNGTGDAPWKVPGVMDWRTMIYDPNAPITKDTTTLFASDRDLFLFLVDDRNPIEVGKVLNKQTGVMEPDLMFRGFYVTNSEVGAGALKLAAFYLRAICCNRIMWGVENFQELNIRHTKGGPARFIHEAEPALISFAQGSSMKLIEGVEKAKAAIAAKDDEEAIAFLNNRGFSRAQAKTVIETTEREEGVKPRSIWEFAQGITAVARSTPNNDARVELELSARKLLDKVA
jgi:hypothetical protein